MTKHETPASVKSSAASECGVWGKRVQYLPLHSSLEFIAGAERPESRAQSPSSRPLAIGNFLFCIIHEHCHMVPHTVGQIGTSSVAGKLCRKFRETNSLSTI